MKNSHNTKEQGFTLIELLVVVAIIGLLSTVIMSSLNNARTRAQNTAKNNLVEQYITALELYYDDGNSSYPDFDDGSFSCLGLDTGEICLFSETGNTDLVSALSEYIPQANDDTPTLFSDGTSDFSGLGYRCKENTGCNEYEIRWYLNGGTSEQCIKGSTPTAFVNLTRCDIETGSGV